MLNVSTLSALVVIAYVLIALYLLRMLAFWMLDRNPDSALAKGLAVVVG